MREGEDEDQGTGTTAGVWRLWQIDDEQEAQH